MVAKSGVVTKSLAMSPFVNRYLPDPIDKSSVGVVICVTSQSGNGWPLTTMAHNVANSTYPVTMATLTKFLSFTHKQDTLC